jgi:hypothetical protein
MAPVGQLSTQSLQPAAHLAESTTGLPWNLSGSTGVPFGNETVLCFCCNLASNAFITFSPYKSWPQ